MKTRFGAIAPRLCDEGYTVIPVKPKTKVPTVSGWQRGFSRERIGEMATNGYANYSIGLLARTFPGADIDIADEVCAQAVEQFLLAELGRAPVRFGSYPKRLLMYRTDRPFNKIKVFLVDPSGSFKDQNGKDFAIEFLGDGQQYLIYGQHPDGFEYTWTDDQGPAQLESWELTTIDEAAVRRVIAKLPDILPPGWTLRDAQVATDTAPAGDPLANLRLPLEDWTIERVRDELLPHVNLECDYDEWIAVGQALHHQFGGSDEAFELWDEFFSHSSKYTSPEYGLARWQSFKTKRAAGHGPVTLASLIKKTKPARQQSAVASRAAVLDALRAQIAAATDATQLETTIAAQVAQISGLTDVERELMASALQARGRELGARVAINTVRAWLRPRAAVVFPHLHDDGSPRGTLENLRVLLNQLGIVVRYNVIKKQQEILIPNAAYSQDNQMNASIARIISECERVGMSTRHVIQFLTEIADANQYNPIVTWVESKPWDGVSRLPDFYATLTSSADPALKETLMRRWLVTAIAAAFSPNGIAPQGMLVLVGEQYAGKTRWLSSLVPKAFDAVMVGHTLDTRSKDSILAAISHWLVELGEIDSTFKKSEISALKAHITQDTDVVRRPYAMTDSVYPRRTVYFGSVNDEQFLHDPTGNRRFWTLPVSAVNHEHGIDMQQLWAEVLTLWRAGERHFLDRAELMQLNVHNEAFTVTEPIEERIAGAFNWASTDKWVELTAAEILIRIGVRQPTKGDGAVAGRALVKLNGNKKRRSNGRTLFLVPPDFLPVGGGEAAD